MQITKLFTIGLLFSLQVTFAHSNKQIIDLTHEFSNETIYWPTEKGFSLFPIYVGTTKEGYFYSAFKFCASEHGGTHIDAPYHFAKNGLTVDKIPLSQLFGEAIVINVKREVSKDHDYAISAADIQKFEAALRPLTDQDIVLFYTGWEKFWPNKQKYLGTAKFNDVKNLHFPGISKEAAEYLRKKKVKGVGLDTPSLDPGNQSKYYWAHQIILGANIYGLENLANLDKLPPKGAHLIVAPLKIKGGSGGPTRIFAIK